MRIEQNLRRTRTGLFTRMRNRDRILIRDNQQQRCEHGYSSNWLEPPTPTAPCRNKLFRALLSLFLPQDFAGSVREGSERLDVHGAFRAIEIMFFVLLPLDLGEFAEHILYCRLQLYCLVMVHLCHP